MRASQVTVEVCETQAWPDAQAPQPTAVGAQTDARALPWPVRALLGGSASPAFAHMLPVLRWLSG